MKQKKRGVRFRKLMNILFLLVVLTFLFACVQGYAPNSSSTFRIVSSPLYQYTLRAANLEVDLFPTSSSPPEDLFVPAEGFICPGSDLCTAPPACICD